MAIDDLREAPFLLFALAASSLSAAVNDCDSILSAIVKNEGWLVKLPLLMRIVRMYNYFKSVITRSDRKA